MYLRSLIVAVMTLVALHPVMVEAEHDSGSGTSRATVELASQLDVHSANPDSITFSEFPLATPMT
jgi:hypothetical protein